MYLTPWASRICRKIRKLAFTSQLDNLLLKLAKSFGSLINLGQAKVAEVIAGLLFE